jgi:hypothetical protein
MTDAATPATATASQDSTLASAARAIGQLEERRRRSEKEVAADAPADRATEGEWSDSASELEDAHDEAEDQSQPDEPRYRVKVDGEEAEVPLRELVQGYQRGADYTRKTMRLADERREVEELRAEVEEELAAATAERQGLAAQAAGAIPSLRAQLTAFDGVDWQRMAAEQPTLHAQAQTLFNSLSQQLQSAEAAQVEAVAVTELQQRRTEELQRRHMAAEKQALMDAVPEMADPVQAPREAATLHRYLNDAGYAAPEIARLVDHRDFVLARKAMLYDRLMASSAKGREKISASRVLPPGTAPEHRRHTRTPLQAHDSSLAQRQHRRCGQDNRDTIVVFAPARLLSAPAQFLGYRLAKRPARPRSKSRTDLFHHCREPVSAFGRAGCPFASVPQPSGVRGSLGIAAGAGFFVRPCKPSHQETPTWHNRPILSTATTRSATRTI